MATNASRRAREKRIRAQYRRKIFVTGIIMLLIGFAAGYLVCMLTTEAPTPQVDEQLLATPVPVEQPEVTPYIIYVTPEPTQVPTAEPVIVTPEPVVITPEPVIATPEPAVVTAEPTEAPTQAPIVEPVETADNVLAPLTVTAATEAPTQAPVVTPAPVAAKSEPVIVPYGESVSFDTQIKADGTARRTVDAEPYETINLSIQVDAHKGPTYFQNNYADAYMLQGNEAAVEFELILNEYAGNTDIIPQNFLLITFRGESDDVVAQGFQLMDTEIGGKTGISIYSDTPTTLYKRYPYAANQGDMVYMVVNTYNDGVEGTYWFEIIDPDPEPLYADDFEALTVGSKGDDVEKLQQKLIDMGLLEDTADGKFGKKTGEAVSACQDLLGFEQTGEADAQLMNALFDVF